MPIKFVCRHCGVKLKVGSRKAGTSTPCPKCQRPIEVPSLDEAEIISAMHQENAQLDDDNATDAYLEFAVYEDAELVYDKEAEAEEDSPSQTKNLGHISVPRMVVYVQGGMLATVAVVCCLFGMMVGSMTSRPRAVENVPVACIVTGNVFYRENNQRLMDEGAVVIAVPVGRTPDIRPDVKKLRPGTPVSSQDVEQQLLRELGGEFQVVASDGQFRLSLESGQSYYLLVVSQARRRPRDQRISKSERAEMGAYFLPIDDLIENRDYFWQQIDLSGTSYSVSSIIFQ